MPDTYDWMVRRTEHGFIYGHDTIIIGRHYGDTTEVVQQISASPPLIVSYNANEALNGEEILRLPLGVLDAIAEAIKPGPSQGEVRRLEEALTIERARVDKALALPYLDPDAPIGKLTARDADLRTGLELALDHARAAYSCTEGLPGPVASALSLLIETVKGTIERDDRISGAAVTPKPVTRWQPPAPPEPR